jgi:hypothetical protein
MTTEHDARETRARHKQPTAADTPADASDADGPAREPADELLARLDDVIGCLNVTAGEERRSSKRVEKSSLQRRVLVELPCPECHAKWTCVTLRIAATASFVCPWCRHTWDEAVTGRSALEDIETL